MGTFSCLFANFIIFFIYFFWQLAFGILAFGFTCAKHTVATQRTYHRVVDLSCVSLAVTGRGGTWRRSEYYPRCRPRRCYYLWRPRCSSPADPSASRSPHAMSPSRPAGWPSMFPRSWPHYPAGEGTERNSGWRWVFFFFWFRFRLAVTITVYGYGYVTLRLRLRIRVFHLVFSIDFSSCGIFFERAV